MNSAVFAKRATKVGLIAVALYHVSAIVNLLLIGLVAQSAASIANLGRVMVTFPGNPILPVHGILYHSEWMLIFHGSAFTLLAIVLSIAGIISLKKGSFDKGFKLFAFVSGVGLIYRGLWKIAYVDLTKLSDFRPMEIMYALVIASYVAYLRQQSKDWRVQQ